jgi:hypothetical protein
MRSTIFFFAMLFFVQCTTSETADFESVPAFVELTNHPLSQAFFSAAAIRIKEESGRSGFSKVMALIGELIHDNRRHLHHIKKVHAAAQGECLITTHKLQDRNVFFNGQSRYFNRRGQVAISEKSESVNIYNVRVNQRKVLKTLLTSSKNRWARKHRKWSNRLGNANTAISKVMQAIRAVNKWSPKSSSLLQTSIKEASEIYSKINKYPLSVPSELIQLASDKNLRKRLFEWLNLLKSSILSQVNRAKDALSSISSFHTNYSAQIRALRRLLKRDSRSLSASIKNHEVLIKVYTQNEKIYTNLAVQNGLLINENRNWCNNDKVNFKSQSNIMEDQLRALTKLKAWLNGNYHKIKRWLRKRYNY